MRQLLLAGAVALALLPMLQAQELPRDLLGLSPGNLGTLLQSKSMTLITSSYRVANPSSGDVIATVTIPAGRTGYILGVKAGGTAAGYMDVYSGSTNKYDTIFFGADDDTGWLPILNWSKLSAAAGSTLSLRSAASFTGTYSASILVGHVQP